MHVLCLLCCAFCGDHVRFGARQCVCMLLCVGACGCVWVCVLRAGSGNVGDDG
jgi:hypothetical protein